MGGSVRGKGNIDIANYEEVSEKQLSLNMLSSPVSTGAMYKPFLRG